MPLAPLMNGKLINTNYMNDFDAKQALELSKAASIPELEFENVLIEIKKAAQAGQVWLDIRKLLEVETIELLKKRGFRVFFSPIMITDNMGVYYSICWDETT
jgi:hypothetical protein